jgi:LysR family transcriptional regulator, benzoate and cis,cis-muconate-responsive activator of ben and cat genes
MTRQAAIELRHMRYFIAVAEERHFGEAAERLRIAQSGLSRQIQQLERLVGAQLLVRDPRGVEITPAGHVFLEYARRAVEIVDRAVASAYLASHGKTGLFRVGIPAATSIPIVTELLDEFQAEHPDIEIEVHRAHSPQVIGELARRVLDVGIVLAPFDAVESPNYLRLGSVELRVTIPAGNRLAGLERVPRSELLTEPFIQCPRGVDPALSDHVRVLLFGEQPHPRPVLLFDFGEANVLHEVARGTGLALTGNKAAEELRIPGIVFRGFDDPIPLIDFGLVWHDRAASPLVPDLVDLAREFTARLAA